jgi:phosphate transport system protein
MVSGIIPTQTSVEAIVDIDRRVIRLFALVSDAIAGATLALLSNDRVAARMIVVRDEAVDAVYHDIEQLALAQLAAGADSPNRLRYLVAVLRLLPELERSGDLAEHIARRAERGIVAGMSARSRGLVERMGEVASRMWRMAADAYGEPGHDVAALLDEADDEMDELHSTFIEDLSLGATSIATTIELVLVGRFYERLGDHAVNLARRVPSRALREQESGQRVP